MTINVDKIVKWYAICFVAASVCVWGGLAGHAFYKNMVAEIHHV
jgi:hypothetical protein